MKIKLMRIPLFPHPRDSSVYSHEKDNEGEMLLQLSPPDVSVRSFSQLSKLLHIAGDNKLKELQTCLEGNCDQSKMLFFSQHL